MKLSNGDTRIEQEDGRLHLPIMAVDTPLLKNPAGNESITQDRRALLSSRNRRAKGAEKYINPGDNSGERSRRKRVERERKDDRVEGERNNPVDERQPAKATRGDLHVGDLGGHADDE